MTIYLLRHAIAVARGTKQYPNDDRPLTRRGIGRMELNASGMTVLGLAFDAIIHSPLSRAHDTAKIVVKAMKPGCPVEVSDALLPEAPPAAILDALRRHGRGDSVLLVGHEPHLGLLGAELLGIRDASLVMKKGGLARIDAGEALAGSGRLAWMLTPRQLRMIGAGR